MPRTKVVPLDRLNSAINEILEEYKGDCAESVKKATKKIANKAAVAIRANAKAKFNGNKYRKGWTVKFKTITSGADYAAVVYNKTHYQLAHLLEKGHVSRNGTGRTFGFVKGRPHIKPVEEMVINEYVAEIKRSL